MPTSRSAPADSSSPGDVARRSPPSPGSRCLYATRGAAEAAAVRDVEIEVIDLRTLWPWDRDCVGSSALRMGTLLVVHEAVQVAGCGAEIAAAVAEATRSRSHDSADPVSRSGTRRTLEAEARFGPDSIARAFEQLLSRAQARREASAA